MGGVVLVAHVVLRRLLEPLRALNTAVAQLGAGQLDVRLPTHTSDEFGRLTDAFNQMVERVRDMIQSRDRLLVDVSHELRSPLTRMKVALELPSDEVQRGRLSGDVAEMERMVSELLELERLRTGQDLSLTPQDLVRILREVASRYEDRAPGVRFTATDEQILIPIDADKIRMVLRNLVENAVKYSLPESRPVEIRAEGMADAVVVRVIDDGVGIPVADAERVFEPFFRVDPSRSKRTGGYGLGLSICKRVMEAHGGTIAVERRAPRGTVFVLTFPRVQIR
jgi:signal transduction histidine kinase